MIIYKVNKKKKLYNYYRLHLKDYKTLVLGTHQFDIERIKVFM